MRARLAFRRTCAVLTLGVCTAIFGALAACTPDSKPAGSESVRVDDGAVAATVNGAEILEDEVADRVEAFRVANGLEGDDAWSRWLVDNGLTAAAYRERVVDTLVDEELVAQAAQERDVEVTDEEVDADIASHRASFEDEEAWEASIAALGFTDETYRAAARVSLTRDRLVATFGQDDADEEGLVSFANASLPVYANAKRSSQILFAVDDADEARKVLDELNARTLEFPAAVQRYSLDGESRERGGDMGWNALVALPTMEYANTLSGLAEGEISGLVTSDDGIRIIMCTDVFTPPASISSLDELPVEFQDAIRSQMGLASCEDLFDEWFRAFSDKASVEVMDMPQGLPYDV